MTIFCLRKKIYSDLKNFLRQKSRYELRKLMFSLDFVWKHENFLFIKNKLLGIIYRWWTPFPAQCWLLHTIKNAWYRSPTLSSNHFLHSIRRSIWTNSLPESFGLGSLSKDWRSGGNYWSLKLKRCYKDGSNC